jgi:hypothetical protein
MIAKKLFSALGVATLALALASTSANATAAEAELTDNPVRVGSRCEVYVNDKRMTPYLCYGP